MPEPFRIACLVLCVLALGACVSTSPPGQRVAIQRTTHGIAHIRATDYEALAYGIAYAHAEDNVCQTADHLVTVRGERSKYFGASEQALLGLRLLPNEQIDVFVRLHMDDGALAEAERALSAEARAAMRGYVAGYNRFLSDHVDRLPATCAGQRWVTPMSISDYRRIQELAVVQLGAALLADAVAAAGPPAPGDPAVPEVDVEAAARVLDPYGIRDPRLGSNGWAFGAAVTSNASGLVFGNPHFPWAGVNRFWQMHLSIPGKLDVMGASIGHTPVVQIGFNRDVAWTHTVSSGRRFTLHELQLVPGNPTAYMLDGVAMSMTPRTVSYEVLQKDGTLVTRWHTGWLTRFGPLVELPRAGLAWSSDKAYALQDANRLNLRAIEVWLGLNRADDVAAMRESLATLGIPWVNTIGADREGNVLYADVSAVPDIADPARCAPSPQAAGLFSAAGLVVLDGSRKECDWQRNLIPIERMPVAVRRDWVQNSNDSYWLSNPDISWRPFSPLIGAVQVEQRLRTRAGIVDIRERLAADDGIAAHGRVGLDEVQAMLFRNRTPAAALVLDDMLALCDSAKSEESKAGCAVLAKWDRRNNLESRGAHLFREWWRSASEIGNVWKEPFDPARPVETPRGLKTSDPEVVRDLFASLDAAVAAVRAAGFALDAPLGAVQVRPVGGAVIGLHGGVEFEGVLNKVESQGVDGLTSRGYPVNYGSSYIQAVTFDERGPVADAILTYGQSSNPGSPYAFDQLTLFTEKRWHRLPFHPQDVQRQALGPARVLTLP